MSSELVASAPPTFAGLAIPRWLFGMRVWITMMLALYSAFWLQIDGASSAAVTVAILALPTRGQAFEKAFYRFGATLIGVTASITISGLFSQERDLFVLAFAGWLGLCVFVANLLDGNRAYGAVLSGYTVAIVSVMKVDAPQDVFLTGMNRGAAIAIGITAVALVNDLLVAPKVFPKALADISEARRKTLDFLQRGLKAGSVGTAQTADIFKALTALHPTISALVAESPNGVAAAAAARSTVAALVEEVMAARAVLQNGLPSAGLSGALDRPLAVDGSLPRRQDAAMATDGRLDVGFAHGYLLVDRDRRAMQGLADMKANRRTEHAPKLPVFRSRRLAARKGFRVGLAVALSSIFFIYSSWPQASIALTFLGAVGALSSTTPDPRGFSLLACVGIPFAGLVVGVTEFIVLDGVDQYVLLCIALAPPVIGACLFQSSPNPKLAGLGFLTLVFLPVILSPSNPQNYNPLSYLVVCVLATTGALTLALWMMLLPPASPRQLRRWLLDSAKADLVALLQDRPGRLTPAEVAYRSADRIGQLAAIGDDDPARIDALADALTIADFEYAIRCARHGLTKLDADPVDREATAKARSAIETMDARALHSAADDLLAASRKRSGDAIRNAGYALMRIADLASSRRTELNRLLPGSVNP